MSPAVDDPDERQDGQGGQETGRGVGEEGKGEAQEAVRSHLEEDGGQDDRPGCGRLDVGVREPGVEREHRDFDGEGEPEGQEEPRLDAGGIEPGE